MGWDAVPEAELGVLARGGDVQALAALVELCRPSLYATAVRLLQNRADALDAVQDTCVVALLRVSGLRDGAAGRAWLHTVLRNICLMWLRRRREVPTPDIEARDMAPGPEAILEEHVMREWLWQTLERLSPEERATVLLRHFTRCTSYAAIAQITAVPVGTVRSRLNRARSRLANELMVTVAGTSMSHAGLETSRHQAWEEFYRLLHERPEPRTYRDLFTADVDVRDTAGHWHGIEQWSAEEREAIARGVRAVVVGVLAASDITVLEVDFRNPAEAPSHCPAQATFVHQLDSGRSARLTIHYPSERTPGAAC